LLTFLVSENEQRISLQDKLLYQVDDEEGVIVLYRLAPIAVPEYTDKYWISGEEAAEVVRSVEYEQIDF
jgi:hypothetical protein